MHESGVPDGFFDAFPAVLPLVSPKSEEGVAAGGVAEQVQPVRVGHRPRVLGLLSLVWARRHAIDDAPQPLRRDMPVAASIECELILDQNMSACRTLSAAGGTVAVVSQRRPGTHGPNQDAAAVIDVDGRRGVLAVADGFGGHPGGAEAARRAVQAIAAAFQDAPDDIADLRSPILNAFERANTDVIDMGVGAATTLSVVEIDDGVMRCYHVGDSEVLVTGQRGRLRFETIAHSPVAYAVEAGIIGPEEAMHHAERHIVFNVVGSPDMRIEVGPPLQLHARDTVLLASDGLFDNLQRGEIVEFIRKGAPADSMAELIAKCSQRMNRPAAGEPSKPDDLTVLAYRPAGDGA